MHAKHQALRPLFRFLSYALPLLFTHEIQAVAGVGDMVIIVEDIPAELRWSEERMKWNEMLRSLQKQVAQNDELLRRLGTAAGAGGRVLESVAKVSDMTGASLALESRAEAEKRAEADFSVSSHKRSLLQAENKVAKNYKVLGDTYAREEARYSALAKQEALLERRAKATENQDKVMKNEFTTQKNLLNKLGSAKTEAEIQMIQASLSASQLRMDLVRDASERAREDYQALEQELALEKHRKEKADAEWSERMVEKLRARALTSLHAQKGDKT
jgi:hypothetical protein